MKLTEYFRNTQNITNIDTSLSFDILFGILLSLENAKFAILIVKIKKTYRQRLREI